MSELKKRSFTSIILLSVLATSLKEISILYLLLLFINFFVLDEIFKIIKKIFKKIIIKFKKTSRNFGGLK